MFKPRFAALLFAVAPFTVSASAVPLLMSHSGRFLDHEDKPVSGTLSLGFSIHSSAGLDPEHDHDVVLWTATHDVVVIGGAYGVLLGGVDFPGNHALDAVFDGSGERWLGVSVAGGDELKPRLRIGSVAHALVAQRAFTADRADVALNAEHLGNEAPADFHDASKLTGTVPASVLGGGAGGITTLGKITTGTWTATPVDDAHVAGAGKWDAKLDAVRHDDSLVGDGGATPLAVKFGTTAGSVASGSDPRFLQWSGAAPGLDAAVGRTSLGLGTAATTDVTAYATAAQGAKADAALPVTGGTVSGALLLPGSGIWTAAGALGVGTILPASKLTIAGGEVQVGTSGAACTSANAGAIRWNGTAFMGCTGTVWITIAASFAATGGTITDVGAFRIHTFTASGTFNPNAVGVVDVLAVGGGGGGGGGNNAAGGGGAGGLLYTTNFTVLPIAYTVTVGAGGNGGSGCNVADAQNGGDSVFGTLVAIGGGAGGTPNSKNGSNGGSGGGGFAYTSGTPAPGSGTANQGNSGGAGWANNPFGGGGGGGAGGAGAAATSAGNGTGGLGLANSISGSSVLYAAGGGGGQYNGGSAGLGGSGIGGNGGQGNNPGTSGATNRGSGGGGGGYPNCVGGQGGSGIVIVRYTR